MTIRKLGGHYIALYSPTVKNLAPEVPYSMPLWLLKPVPMHIPGNTCAVYRCHQLCMPIDLLLVLVKPGE